MRNSILRALVALMSLVAMGAGRAAAQGAQGGPPAPPLSLKVAAYSDGGDIPLKYGCDVEKGAAFITPAMSWTNTPKAAVAFVLIMHDMDGAPMKAAQDVTHWTVYNIPATASGLPEGILPDAAVAGEGMQGKNVRGVNGYQAPCPPKGGPAHHYVFELYALDAKLDLPAGAARADILKAMDGHVVGKTSYVGMFHH